MNTTPYFVAELWDKSGVNITGSSVGHDMMLVIDESTVLSYNLNQLLRTVTWRRWDRYREVPDPGA